MTQFIEVVTGANEPYRKTLVNISRIECVTHSGKEDSCYIWFNNTNNNLYVRHSYEEVKSAIQQMVFKNTPIHSLVKPYKCSPNNK